MSHLTGDIIGFFEGQPIPTTVRYFPDADAYAISFVFYTPGPVQWTFARDLLIDGLDAPTGVGNVRFAPKGDYVIMSIGPEENQDHFHFLRTDIKAIVEISESMMPRGSEGATIDWDTELEGILNG